MPGGRRAKEAVDVLLIGLSRAELIAEDETTKLMYQRQRTDVWSPFLSDALKAHGARVLGDGEPKIGAHGKPVLFLHPKDFCGTLVELEQA